MHYNIPKEMRTELFGIEYDGFSDERSRKWVPASYAPAMVDIKKDMGIKAALNYMFLRHVV